MISLKQSMEQHAEQLLRAALDSYHAAVDTVGEAAAEACPPAGEDLQSGLSRLSAALTKPVSADEIVETTRAIQNELKSWAEHASHLFRQSTGEIQDVLLMAGTAAQQVDERDKRYAKRLTEFGERLHATSRLGDLVAIRQSVGQHTADLKSYVTQMAKESEGTIAQLRAQIAVYESKLEEMEQVASQDPLTGLSNRRKVERHMETRIRAAQVFSIISLDLNGFKQLNDTYGHLAGDDLLKQFATELQSLFRSHDVVARVGGDEFIVLVDGDLSVAGARLERIRRWVNGNYAVKGNSDAPKVKVSAAAGAAQWNPGESMRDVLSRADAAMYADKPPANVATLAS
ncbi:MAG: GGDEF domain-containing protein [Acidobacteriia bacterium]|nr:GGDEF domain-containing protein [Terriglobia bacterium]